MALKADRISLDSMIDFFMNEVAERGGIATISTVGSGAAMDQSVQLATYAANPNVGQYKGTSVMVPAPGPMKKKSKKKECDMGCGKKKK